MQIHRYHLGSEQQHFVEVLHSLIVGLELALVQVVAPLQLVTHSSNV